MTQSFDEYCKKNQHSGNCTRLEAFSMGQKSRQAEVDDINFRLKGSIALIKNDQAEIDELQARIDEVLGLFVGYECGVELQIFRKSICKILEGNKDEN